MKEELAKQARPAPAPQLGVIDTRYRVDCPHPSGQNIGEYGVNAWWFADEGEARAKAAALPGATLARRETVAFVPAGCRKARTRTQWTTLSV